MKYIQTFEFPGVEVVAYKCDSEEGDSPAIKFIAISALGNIEITPAWETEEPRDEAWDKTAEAIAKSLAIMTGEAFEGM